ALVYTLEGNSFTGEFHQTTGEIVSIEMATREGNPVVAELIPENFALHQNYPNPFNPATTISFSLPVASDYELTIYNVNGQVVKSFVGKHDAGVVEISWEAGSHASGVYFYKLIAGSYSATKKMVLLK
ncbi:MAG: T9SS type A sorting domain-containing protein, partial [Candidatus Zixiibacteriota bacterium]